MSTSMEIVYGLLLLIFILGLTELLAFAITLIQRKGSGVELGFSLPERVPGLGGNDSSLPQESTESVAPHSAAPGR